MEEIVFIYLLVSVIGTMCLCEMVRCGVGVLWSYGCVLWDALCVMCFCSFCSEVETAEACHNIMC